MNIPCWKCGKEIELTSPKISFRATCPHCLAYLHCCMNCKNHDPRMANECKIPGTDTIRDREAGNFCEEFSLLGKAPEKKGSNDAFKKLFGD